MFNINARYITKCIQESLSQELILYLWNLIDRTINSGLEMDYLQVFSFEKKDNTFYVVLSQEEPPRTIFTCIDYKEEYSKAIDEKIFVIDDGDYSTMLFAHEY